MSAAVVVTLAVIPAAKAHETKMNVTLIAPCCAERHRRPRQSQRSLKQPTMANSVDDKDRRYRNRKRSTRRSLRRVRWRGIRTRTQDEAQQCRLRYGARSMGRIFSLLDAHHCAPEASALRHGSLLRMAQAGGGCAICRATNFHGVVGFVWSWVLFKLADWQSAAGWQPALQRGGWRAWRSE